MAVGWKEDTGFADVLVRELREAVADRKGGLDAFDGNMPASTLTDVFMVFPLDWLVWYCLAEQVVQPAALISQCLAKIARMRPP